MGNDAKTTMTSRQRVLTAMRNEQPDRVPVAPDISMYIPMRHSGMTAGDFWIGTKSGVPHWQAYLDAAAYYGIDAWTAPAMWLPVIFEDTPVEWCNQSMVDAAHDVMVRTTTVITPDGELTEESICYRGDQAAVSVKLMKDLAADFSKFKHTQPMPVALDIATLDILKQACHSREYAFGVTLTFPGFHMWNCYLQGGVEALSYVEQDTPEIIEEWCELDMARGTRMMELALEADVDYILFGGSGTITMASPALAAKYAIPALRQWSGMAKAVGLPTMIHSCGKNRVLADLLVEYTDVGMLNPLERPPMGDIDLGEVKRMHGGRLAFMGNLHTTDVMLMGSAVDVRRESLQAIRAAGEHGGFILSTGDQCGRDTPDANLFAMVAAAKEFGAYPLDFDAIDAEINRLGHLRRN